VTTAATSMSGAASSASSAGTAGAGVPKNAMRTLDGRLVVPHERRILELACADAPHRITTVVLG
jgi:hypothetical protein